MKKIIKEHEHFEKFMGYKAPEFKSDSGEFHVILWNLNYISNNKNEFANSEVSPLKKVTNHIFTFVTYWPSIARFRKYDFFKWAQ